MTGVTGPANHTSWLDILVLRRPRAPVSPSSPEEVGTWPESVRCWRSAHAELVIANGAAVWELLRWRDHRPCRCGRFDVPPVSAIERAYPVLLFARSCLRRPLSVATKPIGLRSKVVRCFVQTSLIAYTTCIAQVSLAGATAPLSLLVWHGFATACSGSCWCRAVDVRTVGLTGPARHFLLTARRWPATARQDLVQ